MQNKMCDERSTWDVISKSDDFKNNHPTNITSLEPKFTFLHAKDRVLCLVLDTSGSMDSENRIERLQQAAGIFLLQIIEDQSYVGIVGFHSYATEIQKLTVIESEDSRKKLKNLLPKIASGGTNICAGVQAGFQSGAWMYSIQNGAGMPQVVTITVTSRAADENIPPVTVNAHLNQDTTSYPKPLIIFAEVSQGFLPVVGANVTATVERAEGQPVNLELLDNGGGADAVRNDGVYSRYFIEFLGNGRYTIKVSVQGKDGIVRLTTRKQSHAMYIPGYVQNGKEMVRSASNFLYKATKHRVYFRDVKILLPITWNSQPNYQRPSTQSYEKVKAEIMANVIIANPHTQYGDDPYTLQYGQCGDKGRYIHFTQNFMLDDSLIQLYGERGRVLVHEWAHLRWGVFDEYNDLVPFYAVGNTYEATSTGLPDTDCNFFPDQNQVTSTSIMYTTGLPGVVDFCDNKTHNREAPNMQNKMCDERSTWDVISKSDDFKNNHPTNITSLEPKFTFLHVKDRVLCLVLDTSGSMGSENRIQRLQQAAGIFLLQIIEDQSYVGIVGFHSYAKVIHELTLIESEDARKKLKNLLPKISSGGTNICEGVRAGFQVLRGDDGSTNGDEIVLLTDGEDSGISRCFSEVEQSGAVIHTIALGPKAAKELEQLSSKTGICEHCIDLIISHVQSLGGLQYAATDKLDENGLVDAFTGLVSGNGNMSQQSIQLESSGKSIASNDWFNGTVFIDKSVGKNTSFVITWGIDTPEMFIRDPKGKLYRNGNFEMDRVLFTARLPIPGLAQVRF
ncbi:hypothetical protein chiPu_0018800 [Chiloscyllium punctatum]|uniref:VWFA domain-containing protein n=1 Tax=Chiloscyllium punctatum TaxID=137246 RepID=A0A401RPZ6_CHIPU|nr:hypothetical protein [Chiloscyllium punctatum]